MNHLEAAPSGGRAVRSVISITLVCFVVSMIDGFDTLMLSFVAPLLAKSLQIDHASLGRVFGAGFVGTVLGSLIIGPLADRFGRRKMLVLALVVTGGFTLACAFASSAGALAALRFLGGLGMGGAIPPIAAITAESASSERRSSLVILMFIGFPLGAVVGGAITAALMMKFGWPFVFLMGGSCALAAIIPVLLVIPATTPAEAAIKPDGQASEGFVGNMLGRFVGNLFAEGRFAATFALWFGVLASMILSGFLVSFMPTILNLNGVAPDRAALGAVVINVGAIVGALLISLIVRRGAPFVAVTVAFVAGAVMVFTLGRVIGAGNAAFGLLFLVGGMRCRRSAHLPGDCELPLSHWRTRSGRGLDAGHRAHRVDHRSGGRGHSACAELVARPLVPGGGATGVVRSARHHAGRSMAPTRRRHRAPQAVHEVHDDWIGG
jgi:AAHS family 4-hydroxybenzoate transporter-like MFS transporter